MSGPTYFPDNCVCTLSTTEKKQAIREMIRKLSPFRCVGDLKNFERDVIRREEVQSTGLGHGVAIAHGISCDGSIVIGLGISHPGITYDSIDHLPVHLLFMIATPPCREQEYLRVLSALVKLLRKPEFRDALIQLPSNQEKEHYIQKSFSAQLALESH
jgi:PTS system nitrogen regulatory IIA component